MKNIKECLEIALNENAGGDTKVIAAGKKKKLKLQFADAQTNPMGENEDETADYYTIENIEDGDVALGVTKDNKFFIEMDACIYNWDDEEWVDDEWVPDGSLRKTIPSFKEIRDAVNNY